MTAGRIGRIVGLAVSGIVEPVLGLLCRWPVPLPGGYIITGCSTTDPLLPAEVSSCTVACDEASWHFGAAQLSCDSVTGLLSLTGCQRPTCPVQCGAYSAVGSVSGANLVALAVDLPQNRLLAVDQQRHVLLAMTGAGASFVSQVLWGSLGTSGDADGDALAAARLWSPSSLAVAAQQRYVLVADTGNGKIRALSILNNLVFTLATGFAEPKALVLAGSELLVADATAGHISRLPVDLTNLPAQSVVSAATLSQLPGSVGLSRPSWLGYRETTGELFVSEAGGAFGVYRMTLSGARTSLVSTGPWPGDLLPSPVASGAVTAPGAVVVDETVGVANVLLVDTVENRLFAIELMKSGRSCADLGWDSETHGSPKVCGRSEGDPSVLGARCNYTYALGVCCSGSLTFPEAQSFCSMQGARLCTQEELFDNEASDAPLHRDCITGSSWVYDGPYDRANIWSSSPCTVPSTGLPGFMTRSGTRRWGTWAPDSCRSSTQRAFVKCCADRDLMMPTAGFQPPLALRTLVTHGLFHSFTGSSMTVAMDSGRRLLFLASDGDVAQLSFGAARFVAAGQLGYEDVIGSPAGIAWSEEDQLLVADREGHVLRRLDVLLTGSNDIIAGQLGVAGDAGDGGLAVSSTFHRPSGVAIDALLRHGYVATGQHRVRRVELQSNGGVTTVINSAGTKGAWGDRGFGLEAQLSDPQNLLVEQDRVYVADRNNQRVRMLDLITGRVDSVAGPLLIVSAGTGYQAQYAVLPDPNMTSAALPRDLVTTSPVGVAVAPDGSFLILSDEHSQSLLHVDRSVVPRRVRVIQGTHDDLADPKDLLLAENGTLFVSDHASHSIFALEFVCDADEVHYTGGCRALHLRRALGAGQAGDGDVQRRQPTTVTSTTHTITTSTITSTTSELPCWNHILGGRGEDCDSTCARLQGTCDPNIRSNFDFDAFQHSVFHEERVNCERDARSWWDDAMPSYETNPASRNYGWCLGTWNMPEEIPCNALFMEYGQASTTMRRWCKCRREEMCYMTTTTTVPPAFVPTTTFTRTWTGESTTITLTRTASESTTSVTRSTLGATTSPSPYAQLCPQGYNPLPLPLPLTSPSSQNSAVDCGVLCEVTTDCVAFVFDATVGFCATHSAPAAGSSFPVSTDPGNEHYTSCERDPSQPDVLLELLLVDWMPSSTPLNFPGAMALDNSRQLLYFSDTGNHKIKVFDMTRNEVLTAAGIGESFTKFSGDGQPARQAAMATPKGLALDEENSHLYFTDSENHVIRRVKLGSNRLTGIIETVAGTSVGGRGQDALAPSLTRFNYPSGLALEKLNDGVKLYVSDAANHQVVVVDLASAPNVVRKIAGKLDYGLIPTEVGDKGPALAAQVVRPQALAFSNSTQEIFFAEPQQERLRQMDLTNDIIDTALQTYAVNFSIGEGLAGLSPLDYDAALGFPYAAAVVDQVLYTASYGTGEVRQTNLSSGITTAFAGRRNLGYYPVVSSGDGGAAELAVLAGPVAVVAHKARQVLYIAESDGGRVRQVDLSTGIISTLNASIPEESRDLYGMALDSLRDVLFVSSPSQRVVYGFRLDTAPCIAPSVTDGASLTCAEGEEIFGDRCTTQCASGYRPSIADLYCASGILTPSNFACLPAYCSAPWGIAHAPWPSCEEGDRIASGGSCTSLCHSGEADTNLTCDRGVLSPATFTCVLPTTLTVTVTGGSGSGGSSVTAAPVPSVLGGGTLSVVDILELEDSIFGSSVVFNPETAPRSNVALNGSFSFEAVTAGLSFSEVSLLCGSDVLRQPLKDALVEVLALLPEDLQILALLPQVPSRGNRRLSVAALTHRFNLAVTLPTPPPWAELRFGALKLQTHSAQQEWFNALQKVHFLDSMVELAANRDRPCQLPSFAINAPEIPCEEGQVTTASHGICTAKCLEPLHPSEDTLHCFAGIWSPSSFSCGEDANSEASCPVPTGISGAAANPCLGIQASSISSGSYCTPHCHVGKPTESVLACIDGQLQPSTFSCLSQECSAPDVLHAAQPSCLEGESVASGRPCTASCQPGFRPTGNLSCWGGQLVPTRFLCLNFTDLGGAVDDFWGAPGGSSWSPVTTLAPQQQGTESQAAAKAGSFWNFASHPTFHLVSMITGALLVFFLLCLLLRCCLRRWRRRKASAKKEEVAWESAASEIVRQNSVFESTSSPKRKTSRAGSKASSEASSEGGSKRHVIEAAKEGTISRLEGPEVEEILRAMAGEAEAEESAEKMPSAPDQDLTADLDEELPLSSRNSSSESEGPDFELLRLAIEAAKDVERPPGRAIAPPVAFATPPVPRPKDEVFEAMDRELGEAVTLAATAAPLQSRSRSLVAQKPRRPSQTRL